MIVKKIDSLEEFRRELKFSGKKLDDDAAETLFDYYSDCEFKICLSEILCDEWREYTRAELISVFPLEQFKILRARILDGRPEDVTDEEAFVDLLDRLECLDYVVLEVSSDKFLILGDVE